MSSTIVLRKRKHSSIDDPLVLRLSSPSPSCDPVSDSDYVPAISIFDIATSSTPAKSSRPIRKSKPYKCLHDGCAKAYSKPSRLEEHERSHTGDRPFVCSVCEKSYLRESHLQAHARSHLPSSSKPFECSEHGCEKRFWTTQHLRAHTELHKGEKPFKCSAAACEEAFSKHHQLREHVCTAHAPSGTKPYRCEHEGCTKSFMTAQKLRAHVKTHDGKRYTCVHPSCSSAGQTTPTYYPTWTSLQQHMREAHPPTCPHPSCNGRTFTAQKGLRAHMKLHEQRDLENGLRAIHVDDTDADGGDEDEPPQKKRRGGEIGRDFVCEVEGCGKDFKSKKALNNHHNVNHLGRRDFVCTHEGCGRAFGYKHLLQRHLDRIHLPRPDDESPVDTQDVPEDEPSEVEDAPATTGFSIEDITGLSYSTHAKALVQQAAKLECPYPDMTSLVGEVAVAGPSASCQYVFTRAYDLRRHLKAEHGLDVDKDRVERWVKTTKFTRTHETSHI